MKITHTLNFGGQCAAQTVILVMYFIFLMKDIRDYEE